MRIIFTPVKILVFFLLAGSPVLASFWSYPIVGTYSYPQKKMDSPTPWFESPKGIFTINFTGGSENPTVTAPANDQENTETGKCEATISIPNVTYTGNNLTWSMSGASTDSGTGQVGTHVFLKGKTTIVFTAHGENNSTAQDVMEVTVTDNEDPKITLGNDISDTTDAGQCTASIAIPNAVFSDNCSGATLSWTMTGATSGSANGQVGTKSFNIGTTEISYTVIDAANRTISQSVKITVTDNEDPKITLENDISETTDVGQCTTSIAIPNAVFSDNCTGATLSWTMTGVTTDSGTGQVGTKIFNIGTTTINYKVIDAASRTTTQSIDVTVIDNEDPKITLGNDISETTVTGQCTASIAVPNAVFSDNCSGEILSWTMTGVTTDSGTGQVGTKIFNIGTTTINYKVTDAASRITTQSIDVTVSDNENPKITLGNDISETTDAGQCTASIAVPNAVFSDNCSGEILSWTMTGVTTDSGTGQVGTKIFNIGTTTINYKVTDAASRTTTQSIDVTVSDNEDPKITLGNDISETTDAGQCTASIAVPNAVFSDNCTGKILSWTMTGATTGGANGQVGTKIFNIGTTTINYKVIDAANRTISGAIEITVTDEEDPKITLGNDIFDSTGAGQCTASIAVPNVIFSDNCSGETLSWTMTGATSGSANGQVGTKTFNIGTTTINYTVTDAANRTITGAVEVTVTDEEDPKITLGNDIFDTTDPGQCTASIVVPDVSFSDNCSGETLSWNFSGVTTGNGSGQVGPKTFNIGTTTINYNVTDAANRTITGTVEVTVTDEEDPKITLGNDIFDTTDPGQCTASIAIPDAVFSDNCSGEVLSWSLSGVTTGSGSGQVGTKTFNRGITTITYTVTDETGNFMEAIQKVTVNDNEAPVITDLPDITGECPITVIPPTTVDNCDGTITGTTGINDLTFYSSGSIFWIFTDASGNPTGPIEQKIIISDTTAPVPDHNGNLPIISITGCQVSSISELTIPTATDGCEGVIQGSLGEGFQFPYSFYGSNTIEWEFIDSHGNKSAQVQEIELIQVNINGGNLSGIYESVVFDEQIDITSCGEEISVELQLAGKTGNIVHWEKFAVNEGVWEVIPVNDNKHTAVFPVGALESTYYRVLVQAGTCTEYSNSIYIRALPPGAAPTVTNEDLDNEYCLGDTVNLKATSNYLGTQDAIPDSPGDFNEGQLNTKDYDSWLVDGKIRNFTAGGNATKPKNWSGTNNHEFGGIEYDSQDGKFTIAQGNFYGVDKNGKSVYDGNIPTTLESPITDFSNSVSASIDFDQAFYFADDDVATIEISFDGGQNYETLQVMHATGSGVKKWLTAGTAESIDGSDATNYNFNTDNTSISLAAYFDGRDMSNVRIRWSFTGTSDQSVWAMDNIFLNKKIPIETDVEWTEGIGDPDEEPIAIGKTEQKLSFQPDIPGVHSYGGTALINGCRTYSEEGTGLIEILVSYPYAGNDIIMSSEECGKNTVQLNAYDNTITANENNAKGAFSIPDSGCRTCDARGTQVKGSWSSVREGGEPSCLAGSFSDPNDPNSTFTAGAGTYTLTWTLENGCSDETTVTILECDQVNFDGVDDHIDFNNNYNFDGAFSLEVWVKPESINGTHTIFSKRDANLSGSALGYDLKIVDGIVSFNWNKSGTVASPFVINQNRWYHLALIHTEAGEYKLYIDGLLIKVVGGGSPGTNNFRAILGAMDSSGSDGPKYNFNGWIDELRIWKAALTKDQLHRMMNQRIKEDGTEVIGEVIPIHIPDVNWSDLVGYYRMDNIIIGCGEIDPDVGFNGRLVNITSAQENTAPLPYTLFTDNGNWYDTTTWQLPVPYNGINISQRNVWNAPNSLGINGDRINWNIVELNGRKVVNPASSGNIILLGLLDDSGTLDLEGANNSSGTSLTVTHYLELNGILDLNGESQLLQPEGSIIEGSGYLERDQQGTASSYNYNYWSSPVSTQYLAPNSGFKIGEKKGDEYLGVLFDGTDPATPKEIQFNYQYHFADGAPSNPIKISTYWLNKFFGKAGEYSSWKHVTPDSQMAAGEGFTMKGSSGHKEIYHSQNYTFRGMPNNGPITLNIGLDQNYLIGNPYPSAIDANQFIRDNLKDVPGGTNSENVFNGSLYFWSHFAEKTHILKEYVGGYAIYNLAGGVHAIASDARINNSKPNRKGGKKPRQYIPVGQGFFINTVLNPALTNNPNITISGGTVMFNNGQRVFQTESDSTKAVFHSVEKKGINSEPTTGTALREEEKMRLWIKFKSPKGYHRQLLVTMDPKTTSDFDLGYDALLIENNKEDMYWLMGQEQTELLIQGVPDFAPERVLLLGLKIATEGEFIIAIDEMENIPAELPIFLKNIETNTYYNLRDSDFKSKIEIGKIHGRYSIVFDDGDPGDPEDPEDGSGEDDGNDESEDEEDPGDGSSESNGNDEDNGNEEGDGKEDISEEPEDSGPTSRGMELIYSTKNKEIVINNPELSIVKKVVLFNSLGQEIYTYESIDSKVVIELPVEVPSEGMYFIRVYTEEAILVLKFLVD